MPDRQGSRDWTLFLGDKQRFCSRALLYCDGMNAEQFVADELVTDAVLRDRHPTVPWRRIAGLRDVLAHAYSG